jgi:hypothetical protein
MHLLGLDYWLLWWYIDQVWRCQTLNFSSLDSRADVVLRLRSRSFSLLADAAIFDWW